ALPISPHDPGWEPALLWLFALPSLVTIAFRPILKKYMPHAPPPQKQEQQQQTQQAPATTSASPATVERPAAPTPKGSKQASAESETVIEKDLYRITFTNRGGLVKSWILKKFDDDQGRPLELVNMAAAPK